MRNDQKPLNVYMTTLGRQGGMDSIAGLIVEQIEASPGAGVCVTRFNTRGSRNIFFGSFVFASAVARLWLAARRGEVDVLHLNMAAGGSAYRKLLLARIAQRFSVPYVVHLHGGRFAKFWQSVGPYAKRAVDRMFLQSAAIIVLGRFWAELIAGRLPSVRDRITILPNATASAASAGRARTVGAPVHICCLGKLSIDKGTPQLLEALALIGDESGWRATIAGNGDIAGSRATAERLGIAARLDTPGWLDAAAVNTLLDRADILVLPSLVENLPMAILEAFAHGLAVVATPVGAVPEVVDHGRNGLIVPVGDVPALARALRELIRDSELRRSLGAAGRRDHADRYDIRAYVPRLIAIWQGAARSSPRRS